MNKIEAYLASDKKQRYMIYVLVFGLIIYLSVMQVFIPLKDEIDLTNNNIKNIQSKLERNSINKLKRQLAQQDKKLLELNDKYNTKQEEISQLISGLYKLKSAFYDDKEWAKSIDKILQDSIKRDIKIEYIKSKNILDDNSTDLLKKRSSLEISG